MREMRDPGCDNDSVSPTPAPDARAAAIAAAVDELPALLDQPLVPGSSLKVGLEPVEG